MISKYEFNNKRFIDQSQLIDYLNLRKDMIIDNAININIELKDKTTKKLNERITILLLEEIRNFRELIK